MSAPEEMALKVIAHIRTAFPTKFGIPRQSGLVDSLTARVVFEPEYRNPDAFRGLEGFSHLWLIWQFSQCMGCKCTIRPALPTSWKCRNQSCPSGVSTQAPW